MSEQESCFLLCLKRSQCCFEFRGKDETTFANKKKDFGVSFFIYTTDSRCLETQLGETVKGVFVNMLCPWLDDRVVGIGML